MATLKLGRGTLPGPSFAVRQPVFDGSTAADISADSMLQKVNKQAALVLESTTGRAAAQRHFSDDFERERGSMVEEEHAASLAREWYEDLARYVQ